MFARIRRFFTRDLWRSDLDSLPRFKAAGVATLRVVAHTVRSFVADLGNLQAAGLTLLTLLALVPMLALIFGIAKGLGYDEMLDQQLVSFAKDLPAAMQDLVQRLRELVQRTGFGAIGAVGIVVLAYTALKLFTGVEASLNQIWHAKRGRSWFRRITDFVALVVLVPALALGAVSLSSLLQSVAWLQSLPPWLGWVYDAGLGLVPHVMMSIAFTALYKIMPAPVIKWRAAAVGGIVAGSAWIFLYQFYLKSQVGVARMNAIYATFAALPLLLVYLQLMWTLVLVGAELSYAVQNLRSLRATLYLPRPVPAMQERLALGMVQRVCHEFSAGRRGVEIADLATQLEVPRSWVDEVYERLAKAQLLAKANDYELLVPLRPPEQIGFSDVLSAMHGTVGDDLRARVPLPQPIETRLRERDEAIDELGRRDSFSAVS